ncbi:endo-1,4-beta-xylanase [Novipirellula artificiosorum]|uniref:Beta-xylanase n=1 Tax=Novipirellula artificiosorum TaxID=2528016 RepID=A0A5C6D8G3_9BACT|nr:endo-1,4-beta-xylanase [Novipirellula artificiosorum]TWU31149.1 Endo-1,4-beta-xylanase A precursor [Novipirellula artificiosorum]
MSRYLFSIANLLGIILSAVAAFAQTSVPESSPNARSLKQVIGNRYKIGVGVSHRVLQNPADAALIREQFEIITPENCMKAQSIHPAENQWRFDAPDRFVEFAKQNQLEVVGHCLVWAKDDRTDAWMMEENGQPVSRETLLKRIENHVATVVQRYADTATMWDVVNEALSDGSDGLLRDSIYSRTTDLEFIATAFRTAHANDPTAMLIYNDYNCHKAGKREKMIELLTKLKEQNVPVDAYGMQGHFELGDESLPQLRETFDELRKLGMKVVVSELDIDVVTRGRWWAEEGKYREELSKYDPYRDGLPSEVEQQQIQQYIELFKLFDEYQDMIVRVSFWNLHDGQSWLNDFPWNRTNYPLLFDRDRQPKPVFDAIYSLLRQSETKIDQTSAALRAWTADNGNGTYSNPLFYEEFEDPDVIRVGEDYYLAGTTMHMNPGVQLMHSKDLVNWELVGYCLDRLDFGPAFRLEDGDIYGRGIWAPCLRYHNGTFYVFTNINGLGLQVFRSKSIEGPWERNQLPSRHDMSVLFDDDGKVYIISGAHSPYPIEELTPDLRAFVPEVRHELVGQMGEGHHLYKINGKYVDVSAIPGGPVDQMVAVADSIDGPWKVERMVQGEALGVTAAAPDHAQPSDRGLWLHQGGIVDTPSGQWWSIIMSDHGSAGRMVSLVPVTWSDGFPLIGLPGNLRKAPNTWVKPDTGYLQEPKPTFIHDDDFQGDKLNPHWQWNHVPDDSKWSITERPGVLRLHSLPASDFYSARNSLCQRPPGPESIMTVELDTSGLVDGDTAGLALLSSPYAWVGVVKTADGMRLQKFESNTRRGGRRADPAAPEGQATEFSVDPPSHLWLRVHCNFDNDQAVFSWSADGKEFTLLGEPFTMIFQLRTFQGVRPALFNFNTSGEPGGYADFDNYSVQEPRARGIERTIPLGKTVTLTSGADGSFLAADSQGTSLVNIAADSADANQDRFRFQVVDLGLGRVALKATKDRYVSASSDGVVLKDLADAKPRDAETFQWINLMRGDTMLMSLVNHRYLNTSPKEPASVEVSASGPRPDRKGGACFQWEEIKSQSPTKVNENE